MFRVKACLRCEDGPARSGIQVRKSAAVKFTAFKRVGAFFIAVLMIVRPASTSSRALVDSALFSGLSVCGDVTQIPVVECQALEALYLATRGSQWAYNEGWLTTNEPCSWIGVRCEDGHVSSLSLSFNLITGALPREIGALSHLRALNLIRNKISVLPAEIGQLAKLSELYLTGNRLRRIPVELGNLSELEVLHLSDNGITSLPPELGQLEKLQVLHLRNRSLYEVPIEIQHLKNLRELRYSAGSVSTISSALSQLTSIEVLELSNNQLTLLPPSVLALTNLRELDISNNNLIDIPAGIKQLSQLESLNLSGNQLASLNDELTSLKKLKVLEAEDNQLSKLPAEIGQLNRMEKLNLASNQLTELPPEVGYLANLYQGLHLAYNRLEALPASVDSLGLVRVDWQDTQTIAPTEVSGRANGQDTIQLHWSAIPYIDDPGYYEISISETEGGPYRFLRRTNSKDTTTMDVSVSGAGIYFFVLRTYTSAHQKQNSYLWSKYSEEITVHVPTIMLSNGEVDLGQQVTLLAHGFPAGQTAILFINTVEVEKIAIDERGEAQAAIGTSNADVGHYAIQLITPVHDAVHDAVHDNAIQSIAQLSVAKPDDDRSLNQDERHQADEDAPDQNPPITDDDQQPQNTVIEIPKGLAQAAYNNSYGSTIVFLPLMFK